MTVVLLRPLGLGDLLTAVPAMRAVAEAYPQHRRLLAAPQALAPLALAAGAVDEVVDTRPLQPLPDRLRGADVAVDLHGRGPASHRVLLDARPRRLIAFANPEVPQTAGFPRWRDQEHEVVRWCRMLAGHGIAADPTRLDLQLPGPGPGEPAGAVIVHPGAAFEARRWPARRFAAVARHLRLRGESVLITGSSSEIPLAREVASLAGLDASAVAAGRTDLLGLARLVRGARGVICGDTGIAHLATALRTPSVVLFGPTPPALWGPPTGRPWHRTIWRGRRGDPHGRGPDPGLMDISVDAVIREWEELAQRVRRHARPRGSETSG